MPKSKKLAAEQSVPEKDPKSKSSARVKRSKPPPSVQKGGKPGSASRPPCEKCGQIHKRCTAHNKAGGPCGQQARRGSNVCRNHGGNAPAVRKAANERLVAMVIPALAQLERVLTKPDTNDADRIKAALAILNRTGYGDRHQIDIGLREPTPWDHLGATAFIVRGVDNVTVDDALPHPERESISDADDEALEALLDQRQRDREVEASTYIDNRDAVIIEGEVVNDRDANLFGFPITKAQREAEASRPSEHDPDPIRRPGEPFSEYERKLREAVEDREP